VLSSWQRRFYLTFRIGRSALLQGHAADLATAAGAAQGHALRALLAALPPGPVNPTSTDNPGWGLSPREPIT
jgi:hypothetical protein